MCLKNRVSTAQNQKPTHISITSSSLSPYRLYCACLYCSCNLLLGDQRTPVQDGEEWNASLKGPVELMTSLFWLCFIKIRSLLIYRMKTLVSQELKLPLVSCKFKPLDFGVGLLTFTMTTFLMQGMVSAVSRPLMITKGGRFTGTRQRLTRLPGQLATMVHQV